jgi:hypothetical protein
MLRLSKIARQEKIPIMGVALFENADLDALGFPPRIGLNGYEPYRGWVAVSDHAYRLGQWRGTGRWLRGRPFRIVGKSIRLYPPQ